MTITIEHIEELQGAKVLLENISMTARISGTIGSPLEKALNALPQSAHDKIVEITTKSLDAALNAAITTIPREIKQKQGLSNSLAAEVSAASDSPVKPSNFLHKIGVALTGAVGGAFGLPALAIELPLSTTVMLRSIADIAKSHGENLDTRDAQLACISVFALGGPQTTDDAVETGYFGVRSALAKAVTDAAKHVAAYGASQTGAPVINRFISAVATRFSIPVSEKVAAQSVPIIGAAGGAVINTAFIQHFQDIAQGHFTVRRLEKIYGTEAVREVYNCLPKQKPKTSRKSETSTTVTTNHNPEAP